MLDPISDMLTRIRNASRAGHSEVLVPFSRFKLKIAEIMKKKGFIAGVETVEESDSRKKIRMPLKYLKDEKSRPTPYIQGLRRVSRQGQRIYAGKKEIPFTKKGYGFAVVSTSRGLMTSDDARKAGVGGEIICEIW